MSEWLTRDTFAPLVNTQFFAGLAGGKIALDLIEVSELRVSRHNEVFALVFRGPGEIFLLQASYRFEHPALGAVDLFIVPIGQDAQGLYYEALFNRLRPKEEQ